jgi:regulatory protein
METMPQRYTINELIRKLVPPEGTEHADPAEARRRALGYLARREHSTAELCNKLTRAGFPADVAVAVVEELAVEGLQSDARFVEDFVQGRISHGKGPVRIRGELAERGIAAAVADEALAMSGQDWRALARAVRKRRFGARLPQQFTEKARQMRFLQYRGFESDQVRAAMDEDDD